MKHFKDILNEIGDNPMNITDIDIDPTGGLVAYAEDRKLDIDLKLVANRVDNFDDEVIFEVEFDVNDRMDKTHKGNEIKVFSTVKTIMETWLEDLEEDGIFWSTIEFSASKDGSKKDNTGRERLYARFAKMIAKKYDAKVETKQVNLASIHQIYTKYIIKKNISESNEVQLNEIGDRPMNISKFNITSDGELQAQAIDKELDIKLDVWVVLENFWAKVDGDGAHYIIDFYVNGSTDKTGTGNEIKVFSSVKAILDRWFNDMKTKKIHWSTIEFSASKDGSYEDNTGRERLYARYAKMIANKHGAKVELKKKDGYTVYMIKKNISESNEVQLNEIGDNPMNITDLNYDKTTGQLSATAVDLSLGIELTLEANRDDSDPDKVMFTIVFDVNNRMNKTGTGNEIKVFSTVKTVIETWLADLEEDGIPWSSIEFAASKDGSTEASTGRERLYARFAKMLANKYRGKLDLEKTAEETVYVISRRRLRRRRLAESNEFNKIEDKRLKSFKDILNEIGDRPMKIDEFDLNKKTGELFAFASTDGIGLELSIERLTAYDKGQSVGINHEINFLVNHEHEKTGEGNEILIFSTVKAMIERWLKEYTGWQRIIFTGSKDGSEKKNTGRERLYKRFAEQIAKKYSGTVEVEPVTTRRNEPSDGTTFVIVKG